MSNRQRIIDATVELMNQSGSNVGTSQLTEHLSISPGNLYYHFRNREEILQEVLANLQSDLDAVLVMETGETPDARRFSEILIGGAKVLWRYRFFFSSSLELVTNDITLSNQYREFCSRGTLQVDEILKRVLQKAPGSQPLTSSGRKNLAEILWVLWTSWPRYTEVISKPGATEREILRNHESLELILKPYLEAKYHRAVISHTRKLQSFDD